MKEVRDRTELAALSAEERTRVYIAESLAVQHPVTDNQEAMVTIEESATLFSRPDDSSYGGKILVREQVLQRLQTAAKIIYEQSKQTYGLLVVDGFRPYAVQQRYFKEVEEEVRARLGSAANDKDVWYETTKWVADPDGLPPHSTGGAVDCTLCTLDGTSVLMGSHWSGSDERLHPTWSSEVEVVFQERRVCLYDAMTGAGFVNLPTEWWHYSFGDQYWALVTGNDHALYGRVAESGKI